MTDDIVTRLRVTTVADSSHKIYATMTEAADEIEKLRSLIKEILPYMLNDMEQGFSLGPPSEDHIEDTQCPDCQWYEDSMIWKNRLDAGEFKDYLS